MTDILANESKSQILYNFWEPDYKNKSLTIKSHVNTQLCSHYNCYNFFKGFQSYFKHHGELCASEVSQLREIIHYLIHYVLYTDKNDFMVR